MKNDSYQFPAHRGRVGAGLIGGFEMRLHDRIMALKKPAKTGNLKFGPALYNSGLADAAQLAKAADELMAEMAEALSVYADQELGYGVAEEALKQYKTWEEKSQ